MGYMVHYMVHWLYGTLYGTLVICYNVYMVHGTLVIWYIGYMVHYMVHWLYSTIYGTFVIWYIVMFGYIIITSCVNFCSRKLQLKRQISPIPAPPSTDNVCHIKMK